MSAAAAEPLGGRPPVAHRLKCHADSFDEIAAGRKTCDARREDDRVFKVGDTLDLLRTDSDGIETAPRTRLLVTVTHVVRSAGALAIFGIDTADPMTIGISMFKPIAILSISRDMGRVTNLPDGRIIASHGMDK